LRRSRLYRIVLGIACCLDSGMDSPLISYAGSKPAKRRAEMQWLRVRVRGERVAVRNRRCLRAGVRVRPLHYSKEDFDRHDDFGSTSPSEDYVVVFSLSALIPAGAIVLGSVRMLSPPTSDRPILFMRRARCLSRLRRSTRSGRRLSARDRSGEMGAAAGRNPDDRRQSGRAHF